MELHNDFRQSFAVQGDVHGTVYRHLIRYKYYNMQ